MGTVYDIHKEQLANGVRYCVDYRDGAGRRSKRRFKKARDAEAFKKQVEASSITGVATARPTTVVFPRGPLNGLSKEKPSVKQGRSCVRQRSIAGGVT